MKNLLTKAAALRFLKKIVLFNYGFIILFIIAILIIYCIKDSYPETLCALVFAFFSVQAIIGAMIKIFEPKQKQSEYDTPKTEDDPYLNYTPGKGEIYPETEEKETEHYEHT